MQVPSFLKSRLATWPLLTVLVLILFFTGRVFLQKHQIDQQIRKLEAESEKVKRNNEQLSGLIQYLNTPEYEEKAAREKLGLKKDGEHVVVLPPNLDNIDSAQTNAETRSRPRLWFDYFFKAR